jgi:thiol-disulfide isomerase/thioredoxin
MFSMKNPAPLKLFTGLITGLIIALNLSMPVVAKQTTLDLSQYEGKVLYVDFWASWCGPCHKSFPAMNSIREQYQDDDVAILAINLDSDKTAAIEFLQQHPANFDVIYDPEGTIAQQFQVEAMPSTYIFDRTGKAKYLHKGFRSGDEATLKKYINQLLQP